MGKEGIFPVQDDSLEVKEGIFPVHDDSPGGKELYSLFKMILLEGKRDIHCSR
jgi:hypothetical protein